jgi:hypothetical protein
VYNPKTTERNSNKTNIKLEVKPNYKSATLKLAINVQATVSLRPLPIRPLFHPHPTQAHLSHSFSTTILLSYIQCSPFVAHNSMGEFCLFESLAKRKLRTENRELIADS